MSVRSALIACAVLHSGLALAQSEETWEDVLDQFAIEVLDEVQPASIRDGIEYCGVIGLDSDGDLISTPPTPGRRDSCESDAPEGMDVVASYHTHGSYDPEADTEVPSLDDLRGDFEERIDGFIATPGGRVWVTSYEDRRAYLICDAGCVTADPAFRECPALPPGDEHTLDSLREREARDTGEC